jgi:hypothetical protein
MPADSENELPVFKSSGVVFMDGVVEYAQELHVVGISPEAFSAGRSKHLGFPRAANHMFLTTLFPFFQSIQEPFVGSTSDIAMESPAISLILTNEIHVETPMQLYLGGN